MKDIHIIYFMKYIFKIFFPTKFFSLPLKSQIYFMKRFSFFKLPALNI